MTARASHIPVGLFAAASWLATTAVSQTAAPALRETAPAEQEPATVVVSARKRDEALIEVPDSITVFSGEDVERRGIENVRDFSNLTPNLQFAQTSGQDRPTINVRGIAQAQGAEMPIAFVVDGVQAAHSTFISQDLLDIERIEVLRGPQGSLYGRNAIGGAINIVTKQPTNEFHGMARASYGTANETRLTGSIAGPIVEDQLLLRLTAAYNESDGQIRNVFLGTRADGYDEYYVRGLLVYKATDDLSIDLRASYVDNDAGSLTAEMVPHPAFDEFDPGFLRRSVDTISERALTEVSAKLDYDFDAFTLTSITGHSSADTLLFGDADFSPAPAVLQNVDLDVDAFTQEIRLTSNASGAFRWLVGAFYQDRDTTNFLQVPFDDGTGRPRSTFAVRSLDVQKSESWAVFGSASYDVTSDLELTLGLRYDDDRKSSVDELVPGSAAAATFSKLQPKVQLSYSITPGTNVYATFGSGYRSGGFNAFRSAAVSRLYDAETAKNYEIGIKGELPVAQATWSMAAFRLDYDDQQFFFITVNPPTQNIENIDKTRIMGAELELAARPLERLDVTIGLGLIDPEVKEYATLPSAVGNRSPHSTEYTFSAAAQYSVALAASYELRAYANYRRTGRKYWDVQNTLANPPKDFVDLRLFAESERWSAGVFVENLTNTQYADAGVADQFGPGIALRVPSERRRVGAEVRYKF
jgi:iron complex outermembrane receptor protein